MSSPRLRSQVYHELIVALGNRAPLSEVREIVERCPEALQEKDFCHRGPLFDALSHGADLDVVQYLVEKRPKALKERGWYEKTVLQVALELGASDDVIRYLIEKRPEAAHDEDEGGTLPLHAAVENGRTLELVALLVEANPEALRVRDANRHSPLTGAIMRWPNRSDEHDGATTAMSVVDYLIARCPESLGDPDELGQRFMHVAAARGAPPTLPPSRGPARGAPGGDGGPGTVPSTARPRRAPPRGSRRSGSSSTCGPSPSSCAPTVANSPSTSLSPRTKPTRTGATPPPYRLRAARRPGPVHSREVPTSDSMQGGGDSDRIPLHHALIKGSPRNVLSLLLDEWPESIREVTKDGESILHVASPSEYHSLDTVRSLVDRDVGIVDTRSAKDGSLPVHAYAAKEVFADDESALEILLYLVELRPESVVVRDGEGGLPVHRAIHRTVSEHLVGLRPETLGVKNRRGSLPLHAAVSAAGAATDSAEFAVKLENVEFLTRQRPESLRERDNDGNLPIHLSVGRTSSAPDLARSLAAQDPDSILERNDDGLSPLHLVVDAAHEYQSLAFARILVERRPDLVEVGNDDGLLPLHLAAARGGNRITSSVQT